MAIEACQPTRHRRLETVVTHRGLSFLAKCRRTFEVGQYRGERGAPVEAPAQQLGPEFGLQQARAVVVLDCCRGERRIAAYPGVCGHDGSHARVAGCKHQSRRGGVAQTPDHHPTQRRTGCQQGIDRHAQVGLDRLEIAPLAFAVTHAAVVEAQGRIAAPGEGSGQQDELPMAAHAILWPADHDQDAGLMCPHIGTRLRQDAPERRAVAPEGNDPLGDKA